MSTNILILAILLVLSAVFSGSETALVSVTKSKVDSLVSKKVSNAKLLQKLKRDPHKLLITVLIGNNVVNVGASAFATVIFTELFGSSGVGIATGIMTFLILIFGEITPKAFCHQYAEKVSLTMAKPIYVMQIIFFPFIWLFSKLIDALNGFFGDKRGVSVTEGELVAMLKIGEKEGSIDKQEKEFIENVLEFNDIEVEEVMTPRVAIEALSHEATIEDAINFAMKHSHSRIPVYEENMDHIIGIITVKDILKFSNRKGTKGKQLKDIKLNHPLEVPFSKKINELFLEFQKRHVLIAVVIDEHGGTAGLVTMEDLLEEIVGEIVDEDDVAEKPIEIVNPSTIIAKGSLLVEDINDFFRIKLGPNERKSVHTMLTDHLHRFPRAGETVNFDHVKIKVLKMKKNTVQEVKIWRV